MKSFLSSTVKFILMLSLACSPANRLKEIPGFEIVPLPDNLQREMTDLKVFGPGSPVPVDRLRLVKVKHIGFDEREHEGALVVLDACANHVRRIFQELYERRFPIEKIKLITEYRGDDDRSMADNNTSAHNHRMVTGGTRISLHAYGTAVDLNPKINPYVLINDSTATATYKPPAGIQYANRLPERLGKPRRNGMAEEVVDVFARHGFYGWGGNWDTPIDYQHFQVNRPLSETLAVMEPSEAAKFFTLCTEYFNRHKRPIEDEIDRIKAEYGFKDKSVAEFYKADPVRFGKVIR